MTEAALASPGLSVSAASDDSRPVIRKGLAAIAAFVLVFFVGGALTPLDAAVMGQGRIAVAGNRQSVQHRDGGIVSKLNIREGQRVKSGEILLEVDATELRSKERVLARQTIAFQMREARLQAELDNRSSFERPGWMSKLSGEDSSDAEGAYISQNREFEAKGASLRAQNSVLAEKTAQLEASIVGIDGEMASTRKQQELARDQLADIKSLYDRGYAPLSRVRSLESSLAELEGRLKSLDGDQNRDKRTITEFEQQRGELVAARHDAAAGEVREVQTELLTLEPQLDEVRAQIARAQVRATASGQVVGLSVFTVGGVVAPGQMLMEIVPDDSSLVIEVMVRPQDAQNVHIGQKAQVKFSIAHARRAPRLFGSVTAVSADQLVNEKTGQPYFKVQAKLPAEEMARAKKALGEGVDIGPGMPAEVVIPTRGRTALGYLLDPIQDALWRGLHEE